MALDLLQPRPLKRPRLAWDHPPLDFLDQAARLHLSRLLQAPDKLCSSQTEEGTGVQDIPSATKAGSGSALSSVAHNRSARAASPPWREDDKDGHFNFDLGENLTSRYKILSRMGEGTFGRVLECWDREAHEYVAIKVIRSAQKYRDAAMIEVDVLRILAKNDKTGLRGCVQIRSWFDYRNHVCIVFEKLGPSLFNFLRTNNYRPFSVDLVRDFGQQLLESVAYMHDLSLIHTDLKPENVVLVSSEYRKVMDHKKTSDHFIHMKRVPKSSRIKLIDFGSATYEGQDNCSVVSTRHYRAPEVILGQHRADKYFRHGEELNWPQGAASRESVRAVRRMPRLKDIVMKYAGHSSGLFLDLLQGLLKYDDSERLTAKAALDHPFFRVTSGR